MPFEIRYAMIRITLLFTILTSFFCFLGFSQQIRDDFDFSRVDSIAKTVKYKNNLYKLTKELTSNYSNDRLKVRAIFIWITDNIKYDYRFLNKEKELKLPKCKPGMNCEQLLVEWENKYINRVLKKRRGICDGYARLLKKMCDLSNIRSEIVSGYTKTKAYQVGNAGIVNHAWNAVWIDSSFHFLDATWAAGYCIENEETGKLLSFQKKFNDYYWFTPFKNLFRNHYPQDAKWVFEPNYTKERFAENPYYSTEIISKIKLITPSSGVINAKKGDTLYFKFDYRGTIGSLQINTNNFRNPDVWKFESISKRKKIWVEDTIALKKQKYTLFERDGYTYEFKYIVTESSLYYLDVLFDFRQVLRFKVNIKRESL